MVCTDFLAGRRIRPHRIAARRSSGHRAAELRGRRHAALGLPARRHRDHAGQLARQGGRAGFLHREFRGPRRRLPGRFGGGRRAIEARRSLAEDLRGRWRTRRHDRFRSHAQRARGRGDAPRQRRSLVGHALYVRNHVEAEGRAAAPPRRAGRRYRACGAKPLPARRAHARRDAALPHHGGALADRDVADRRHLRLPAALRHRPGAGPDRGGKDHQSLSGADALSRSRPCPRVCGRPTSPAFESSASPALR